MTAMWVIARREVYAFFVSPMAYVLMTAWLLLSGLSFWEITTHFAGPTGVQDTPLTWFFGRTLFFYLLLLTFVPVVTMRLMAEERSRGTLETLMTAPVHDYAVILGKYLATLVFWVVFWAPTVLYVYVTSWYGDIDPGVIAASYVGVFAIGAAYLAIGLLMSTISKNQIIAAAMTFTVLCALFMTSWLPQLLTEDQYRDLFAYMSVWGQMEAFSRGVIDSRNLLFNGSIIAFCLPMAVGALRARRTGG